VDGILVVIQPEKTNKDAIKAMMKQLEMVNTPILGVVANRIKKRPGYYTDYYHKEN
jgi:Mrp family chromosome partitioning ATPase